jgi:transcription elongation GreA/GreB family factor
MDIELKIELHLHCRQLVDERIAGAKATIAEAQKAAEQETKSSAGDKYETGREMLQQEQNKASLQFMELLKLKKVLDELNPARVCKLVEPGCLLQTDKGSFYFSVSLGQISMKGQSYMVISPVAPLARLLAGKRVGEQVQLNGRTYIVKALV